MNNTIEVYSTVILLDTKVISVIVPRNLVKYLGAKQLDLTALGCKLWLFIVYRIDLNFHKQEIC